MIALITEFIGTVSREDITYGVGEGVTYLSKKNVGASKYSFF